MAKYDPLCNAFITQIKRSIIEKNIIEVNANQRQRDASMLIDVRDEDEWIKGRLLNAIHVPRSKLEFLIEKVVFDTDASLILYCGGGGRSALAAHTLLQMGYKNVASMAGGYRAWLEGSLPVTLLQERQ